MSGGKALSRFREMAQRVALEAAQQKEEPPAGSDECIRRRARALDLQILRCTDDAERITLQAARDGLQQQLAELGEQGPAAARHVKDWERRLLGYATRARRRSSAYEEENAGDASAFAASPTKRMKTSQLLHTRGQEGTKYVDRLKTERSHCTALQQKLRIRAATEKRKAEEHDRLRRERQSLLKSISAAQKQLRSMERAAALGTDDAAVKEQRFSTYVLREQLDNVQELLDTTDARWADELPQLSAHEERIYRGLVAARLQKQQKQQDADARRRRRLRQEEALRAKEAERVAKEKVAARHVLRCARAKTAFRALSSVHYEAARRTVDPRTREVSAALRLLQAAQALGAPDEHEGGEDVSFLRVDLFHNLQLLQRVQACLAESYSKDVAAAQLSSAEGKAYCEACPEAHSGDVAAHSYLAEMEKAAVALEDDAGTVAAVAPVLDAESLVRARAVFAPSRRGEAEGHANECADDEGRNYYSLAPFDADTTDLLLLKASLYADFVEQRSATVCLAVCACAAVAALRSPVDAPRGSVVQGHAAHAAVVAALVSAALPQADTGPAPASLCCRDTYADLAGLPYLFADQVPRLLNLASLESAAAAVAVISPRVTAAYQRCVAASQAKASGASTHPASSRERGPASPERNSLTSYMSPEEAACYAGAAASVAHHSVPDERRQELLRLYVKHASLGLVGGKASTVRSRVPPGFFAAPLVAGRARRTRAAAPKVPRSVGVELSGGCVLCVSLKSSASLNLTLRVNGRTAVRAVHALELRAVDRSSGDGSSDFPAFSLLSQPRVVVRRSDGDAVHPSDVWKLSAASQVFHPAQPQHALVLQRVADLAAFADTNLLGDAWAAAAFAHKPRH